MRMMHWLSGVGFLFAIFLGIILTHTSWIDESNEVQYILLHKSFGLLVFFLATLRIIIRFCSEIPNYVADNKIEKFIEKFTHYFLFLTLFLTNLKLKMIICFIKKIKYKKI